MEYRCNQTVDLEEAIAMTMNNQKQPENAKIIAEYVSGRIEEHHSKLNRGGVYKKSFYDLYKKLLDFPTIRSVKIVKY